MRITNHKGAIDHRQRLRDRRATADDAVVPVPQPVANPYDPPLEEQGGAITADAALQVPAVEEVATTDVKQVEAPPTGRTPQEVREQAVAAVATLLQLSDAEYQSSMVQLSTSDPVLYAAVVDEINNARAAAESKTV